MHEQHNPSRSEQIAWAAGLFEGEGTWNAYQVKPRGKIQMQARVGMTDRDVVERFAEVIGFGKVYVDSNRPRKEKTLYT